jgi:hypothetical protein
MLALLAQMEGFDDWGASAGVPELSTTTSADLGSISAAMAWILPMLGILSVIGLAIYIYSAIAMMAIAKKTNTPNGWMAWIPIANTVLLWQMSQTPVWTLIVTFAAVILAFIPVVGQIVAFGVVAISIFWWWKICEKLGYPTWWSVMQLVLPVWLVMLGIMAWGKPGSTSTPSAS